MRVTALLLAHLYACDRYECEPVLQSHGTRSGFEACHTRDGRFAYANRVDAVACATDPRSTVPECVEGYGGECATDDECSDGRVCGEAANGWAECECWAVCASDAECGSDEACACALVPSPTAGPHDVDIAETDVCVQARCRTGADCESGECGAVIGPCGFGMGAIACRTKDDECRSNDECGPRGMCTSTGGKWTCSGPWTCE